MNKDFGANNTLVEVIKDYAPLGTYFRDIYSGVNGEWYRISQKGFVDLNNIDQKYYRLNYYYVIVNKYGVKCRTSLGFWENKGWINSIDSLCWFQWHFRYWPGGRFSDDKKQIAR